MKSRPILFSAPMVRALLAGTKTQTRRIIKDQSIGKHYSHTLDDGRIHLEWLGTPSCGTGVWGVPEYSGQTESPYGLIGDQLWVRETWRILGDSPTDTLDKFDRDDVQYRADDDQSYIDKYRPSIHMPRWASRITLEITEVRVERLQDISEADAVAEGIEKTAAGFWSLYGQAETDGTYSPIASYRALWESINGQGSWDLNPWVWALDFRRLP